MNEHLNAENLVAEELNLEALHKLRYRRAFFRRDPIAVAADLIGQAIMRRIEDEWVGGRIVETEAYLAVDDPASHSRAGIRPKCKSMFADAGTLYVYSIHAKHCMNVVTQRQGIGSAVLIRAIEPIWGVERMRKNRGHENLLKLTRGPGMLCQSLAITKGHDGLSLIESDELLLFRLTRAQVNVGTSTRIGIREGVDMPLRFYLRGSRYVSGLARHRQ